MGRTEERPMKPIHNQGKQCYKRLRRRLGLQVCRNPLPLNISIKIPNGVVSAAQINNNPQYYENMTFLEVVVK